MHHFFIPPQDIQGRIAKISDLETIKQISRVLRLVSGEEILLLDGDGLEYVSRIIKVNSRECSDEILKRQMNMNEPELKIAIFQALIKKDNMELVVQKGTEVGASVFVPVLAERSEKKGFNPERAQKILKEASEQSHRGIIPSLSEPQDFLHILKAVATSDIPTMFLHTEGEPIKNFSSNKHLYALNIFVGPEGGWSEAELEAVRLAIRSGAPIEMVNLGSRVLRAETAGLLAAGIMLNR